MMSTLTRPLLGMAMMALALGCQLGQVGPGLMEGPVCVARDASMREVKCPADSDSYSGDPCTCVSVDTREDCPGRVQGGM